MATKKPESNLKISKTTGQPVDPKRSRAAKKAAKTRRTNVLAAASRSALKLHHKILAGGAVAAVMVLTFIGIRTQIEAYAASTATGTFIGLGGKCLDNGGSRLQNGNRIQLYKCNGTAAQKWVVTTSGSLKANGGSDYCLDVPGNSKAEYAYLQLYKCNDTGAQHFTIKNNSLVGNVTQFCATVHYADVANGTRLWMKACHGSPAQTWKYSGSTNGDPTDLPAPKPGPTSAASGNKWGSAWTLGQTKPSGSNTGTGIVRPKPTVVASSADGSINNGILTITKSLKDRIVPYTVKVDADNLTIENCDIKGDPSHPASSNGAYSFINTNRHTGTLAQFNEIHSSYVNEDLNGIQAKDITARYNNIHHVVDGMNPTAEGNNNFVMEGNYVHDFMFYAPSKHHDPTPVSASEGGKWAQIPWDHADGGQVQYDSMTGVRYFGNTIVALWARDGLSTAPLPPVPGELSCFMLNGGRNLDIGYNWLDGGVECINNADANVTGKIYSNRFGRQMRRGSSTSDASYLAMMIASPNLLTTNNVWEDTGSAVPRKAN